MTYAYNSCFYFFQIFISFQLRYSDLFKEIIALNNLRRKKIYLAGEVIDYAKAKFYLDNFIAL